MPDETTPDKMTKPLSETQPPRTTPSKGSTKTQTVPATPPKTEPPKTSTPEPTTFTPSSAPKDPPKTTEES